MARLCLLAMFIRNMLRLFDVISGAKARVLFVAFAARINSCPDASGFLASFSAACEVVPPSKKHAWTRRSTLQPAGRPALQFHALWVGEAVGGLLQSGCFRFSCFTSVFSSAPDHGCRGSR